MKVIAFLAAVALLTSCTVQRPVVLIQAANGEISIPPADWHKP